MTKLERSKSLLAKNEIAEAEEAGAEWGYLEADLWRDQHAEHAEIGVDDDGYAIMSDTLPSHPEWTMGTWCGDNPIGDVNDEATAARAEAYEYVLDCAARAAWDSYIEEERRETAEEREAADA